MAKEESVATAVENTPAEKKKYSVVGLKETKVMPIEHNGIMYDLSKLTDEQLEKLIEEKCPYVVKG